ESDDRPWAADGPTDGSEVDLGEAALRNDDAGEQHRVGRGQVRLDHEQRRSREESGRKQAHRAIGVSGADRERAEDREYRPDRRRYAIGPDRVASTDASDCGGLQPIDADRLLVERLR